MNWAIKNWAIENRAIENRAIENRAIENRAIENRAVYDFGVHPSIRHVEDPEFKAVNMICHLVNAAGDRAAIVDLETVAGE